MFPRTSSQRGKAENELCVSGQEREQSNCKVFQLCPGVFQLCPHLPCLPAPGNVRPEGTQFDAARAPQRGSSATAAGRIFKPSFSSRIPLRKAPEEEDITKSSGEQWALLYPLGWNQGIATQGLDWLRAKPHGMRGSPSRQPYYIWGEQKIAGRVPERVKSKGVGGALGWLSPLSI